jgi:mono/diheme cytochrome c family protein
MNLESHKSEAEMLASEERGTPLIALIILLAIALYAGMIYLDRHAGGFSPLVYAPYHDLNAVANAHPPVPGGADLRRGRAVYEVNCQPCHQASGLGAAGQWPPLAGSEWVTEKNPGRLIRIPQNGLSGPITVKGQEWNLSMPNQGAMLSDDDMAALLSFIRQEWGNKAPPVTADQVKKVRAEIGDHGPWTASELKAISAE